MPGVAFDAVAFLKDQHKRLSSMQTNAALDLKRVSEGDSCDPGCKRLKVVCREEADLPDLGCAVGDWAKFRLLCSLRWAVDDRLMRTVVCCEVGIGMMCVDDRIDRSGKQALLL